MFNDRQTTFSLDFARHLSARDYAAAHAMLSAPARTRTTVDRLQSDFERMIPLDWGAVEPIEVVRNPMWNDRFVYVSLGGDVYSEAIIVHALTEENGEPRIDNFEFGRP